MTSYWICRILHRVNEEALCHEFALRNVHFEHQVPVDVVYKNYVIHGQRLDLLVYKRVVLEIKSVQKLADVATEQVL